jgi:hypothetical protein
MVSEGGHKEGDGVVIEGFGICLVKGDGLGGTVR